MMTEKEEMESNVLQMLQSPAKSMQKLGLEVMQSNSLECPDWFDGLNQIYEIKFGEKAESKDDLLDFFNESSLDLSHRNLSKLPKSIGLLVNLKVLYLDNNKLTCLPFEFGVLVNLEGLDLHNNQLIYIPSEMGALVKLKWLYLHANQLTSIPSELGKLVNLEELYLNYNKIPKDHVNHLKTIIPKDCEFYY